MTPTLTLVIAALLIIETGGERHPDTATGDNGRAVGCLQIHPETVEEANRVEAIRARKDRRAARPWTLQDRTSRTKSLEMARVVLGWHYRRGTTDPVVLACKWNRPYGPINPAYRVMVEKTMERVKHNTQENGK